METLLKTNVKELRKDIKERAEKQIFYKNQRKTKKLVGERKMEPWKATMEHKANRLELRKLYAVYAILKGRKITDIDSLNFKDDYYYSVDKFLQDVNVLVELYKEE